MQAVVRLEPELQGKPVAILSGAPPMTKVFAVNREARNLGVEAGLTKVTHLFNAMSSASKKGMFRQPGVPEYALADQSVFCELVADGFHAVPTLMRMAYNAKGPDRIMLITDALAGAGKPLGYEFRLGRLGCKVGPGYGMLADGSALAGSMARTIDLVRQMTKSVGVPLPETVRMASLTPARVLGREKQLGVLWRHGVQVAALSYAVARRLTSVSADTAMLAGLLQGIGRLYILTRASRHPSLFADPLTYQTIEHDWHLSIAAALLENWGIADEIVQAVHDSENFDRETRGTANLADVLVVATILADLQGDPHEAGDQGNTTNAAHLAPASDGTQTSGTAVKSRRSR